MQEQEALSKVVEIITPFCKNEEGLKSISKDSNILQDLGVNSARLVDIILAFEDSFDIEIDDDAADSVQTIGNAVDMIVEKTSG